MPKNIIDPALLRKFLDADFATGKLTWKRRDTSLFPSPQSANTWNSKWAGKPAFTSKNKHGYFQGGVLKEKLSAHRVVWAMFYGQWPEHCIDHINGDRSDNRIENLRSVTVAENQRNMGRSKANKSGVSGVSWCSRAKKWRATGQHTKDGLPVFVHLGMHSCIGRAIKERNSYKRQAGYTPMSGVRSAFPS